MIIKETSLSFDLGHIKQSVYDRCGLQLTHLKLNPESTVYGACSFQLNGNRVEHRTSKITPKKEGQFVTIWKRNEKGTTAPFDLSDSLDFILITSKNHNHIGQFIFPKAILADKGILSQKGKGGKRGIRVYPPWDQATNPQAIKTQNWQIQYFVTIDHDAKTDLEFIKRIFEKNSQNCI